ncbi:MAG: bile acid:sodium symporter family protein [Phycisphaerae bacterium]|nr:bile acid:sodium symporter family protein [Phycisphaerae bacterium]
MDPICKACLALSGASLLCLIGCWIAGYPAGCRASAVACMPLLAVGLGALPALRGYRFTAWIIAAVVAAMVYPQSFLKVGSLDLRNPTLILLVIQLVMFGMGTQMNLRDFWGVLQMPKAVIVGTAAQFTIMPLVGFALARALNFPPEIGAGIILIGSCSSGLASNVMNYIAGANLALSVTLVAFAQLLAPVMTPLWMTVLVGQDVEVRFLQMMKEIVLMVVLPIFAALIWNEIRRDRLRRVQALMPVLSMAGIIYFTAVTTAAGRDHLLQIGPLLFAAAVLHNTAGYLLGYGAGRLFGLDRDSCRTIAIEVGLQNGGMASGLAGRMGKLATMGLAAAIFSPWMNVSGSVLANYWRRRKAREASIADG